MASLKDIVKEKIKLFDSTPDKMGTATEKVQLKIWKELLPIVNDLEVDKTGNIIQSDNNVARIGIIADKLNEALAGKEYQAVIKTFLNSIDEGVVLSNEVAKKFDPAFEPTAAQTKLLQISKTNAIDTFIGSGLKNNVTQPFVEQLVTNISARAPLSDTIKALEGVLIGNDKIEGNLLRHIKTNALTAQAVADRSYSSAINETIGAIYFEYLGGEIPTTRPFCQHREGEVFHKGEIEKWGRGENSAGIDDIEDGTWAGRIDGTDAKSIFTFVGGWNCRHYLVPIEEDMVDDSVKSRAKSEGFTKEITNIVSDSEFNKAAKDDRYQSYFKGDNNEKTLSAYAERGYQVNYALRDGKLTDADKQYIKNLDNSLNNLPTEKIQNLYRGVNLPTKDFISINEGGEINFSGYTSTTKDIGRVENFIAKNANAQNTPTIFKIVSHKNGKSIEKFSSIKTEQEVLFIRNTKWKIISKEGNVITIEQL